MLKIHNRNKSASVHRNLFTFVFLLFLLSSCKPDLIITQGSFSPSTPQEGDVMNINLVVKNNGKVTASDAKISIFFEIAGIAYAPPSNSLPAVTLSPGDQTTVSFQWKFASGWGNKRVHLFAEADVGHSIDELDEQNNRYDFGDLFILPTTPFTCGNNQLIIPKYKNKAYQCFDIRTNTLDNILSSLNQATERVFLYGDFAAINTPVTLLHYSYDRIIFLNNIQFQIQTNNVSALPIFDFKDPSDPLNLLCVTVYDNITDLQADCGAGVDACAWGHNISVTENAVNPLPSITGISKGNINYYYNTVMPSDCLPIEFHEFQHIIDRLYLKPHDSWFEEMVARLFANPSNILPLLCPSVQFTDIQKVENGQTQILTTLPSLWEMNSTLPLENFGTQYANGDVCKQAIILQINRDALAGGQTYLRKLFSILSINDIDTDQKIAQAVLLANGNDPAVKAFLQQNGCIP